MQPSSPPSQASATAVDRGLTFTGWLVCAIAASGYLAYQKATNGVPLCTAGGGCMAALYSPWGYILGIPLAYIGLTAATILLLGTPWRRCGSTGRTWCCWI